jgi:hypothetical protein
MNVQGIREKLKETFKAHQESIIFNGLEGELVEPIAAGDHIDIFFEIYAKGCLNIKSEVIARDKYLKLTCILANTFNVVNLKQIGSTDFEASLNDKGKSIMQSAFEQTELEEKIEKQPFHIEYLDF